MFEDLIQRIDDPRVHAAVIAVGSILLAFIIEVVVINALRVLAQRTRTDLDDLIVAALQRPIFFSTILIGLWYATKVLIPTEGTRYIVSSSLKMFAVILWTAASLKIGSAVLQSMGRRAGQNSALQTRSVPMFEILLKVLVISVAGYLLLQSWDVNVSAWVASAGVLGIAIGFAAKDSLANLFAGIFIIADAPYRIGDFIHLEESKVSGTVTDIGMRSTRLLTRDDVEINIPNSLIGNSTIINETGGPHRKARVAATVSVAYGSDVDKVQAILMGCAEELEHLSQHPPPQVHFREFGASGLDFALLVWIDEPSLREVVVSELNTRIYKSLNEAEIEIPYEKRDIFIKEFPGVSNKASPAQDAEDDHGRSKGPPGARLVASRKN